MAAEVMQLEKSKRKLQAIALSPPPSPRPEPPPPRHKEQRKVGRGLDSQLAGSPGRPSNAGGEMRKTDDLASHVAVPTPMYRFTIRIVLPGASLLAATPRLTARPAPATALQGPGGRGGGSRGTSTDNGREARAVG
jgi:hypothetical protein